MFLNLNFFFLSNHLTKVITLNLKFIFLLLYYINTNFFFLKFNKSLFLFKYDSIINSFYKLILQVNNLNIIKLLILSNSKSKLSRFGLPKKYSLTTVLKSPHTDKRSREQFHIIHYKSSLKYPLFLSIYNNTFLHSFFLFERGFNVILKTKSAGVL